MVNFLHDSHAQYQVIVRFKDDHEKVSTSGITYSILATDPDWMLPWPKTVVAPSEQAGSEATPEAAGAGTDSSGTDNSGT